MANFKNINNDQKKDKKLMVFNVKIKPYVMD